jgi:uncharacterized protein (DUF983 family)
MSKANPSFIVYIVGLLPLGFMLNWIEQQLNDSWWVVVIVIVYPRMKTASVSWWM